MLSKEFLDKVTMVIRSSNERTEQLCKKLILKQGITADKVFVIREVPFSAAMKKAFNLGINNGLKWTYCIDADVLLRPDSILKMLELAERQEENVCEIQGLVVDKFFGGPRQAGNHLYRTALLHKVINKIPEEGKDIRPEAYTLSQMKEAGYPYVKVPQIIGIHDHEQFFYDIYRKCFTQGIKHINRLELFVSLWREKLKNDQDYEVALKALADSIANSEEIFINRELNVFKEGFEKLDIAEKEEIEPEKYELKTVERLIEQWEYPDIYYKYFPYAGGLISNFELQKRKIIKGYKKYSFFDFIKKSILYLLPVR